jgi:hypothetical protein
LKTKEIGAVPKETHPNRGGTQDQLASIPIPLRLNHPLNRYPEGTLEALAKPTCFNRVFGPLYFNYLTWFNTEQE